MQTQMQSRLPKVNTAAELLDLFYLDMRSALVETASAFDRIQRAEAGMGLMKGDQRIARLREACRIAAGEDMDRTEQILRLFSEPCP